MLDIPAACVIKINELRILFALGILGTFYAPITKWVDGIILICDKRIMSNRVLYKKRRLCASIQKTPYKATSKLRGLSSQVIFHHRENKHGFVRTIQGKWQNLYVLVRSRRSYCTSFNITVMNWHNISLFKQRPRWQNKNNAYLFFCLFFCF